MLARMRRKTTPEEDRIKLDSLLSKNVFVLTRKIQGFSVYAINTSDVEDPGIETATLIVFDAIQLLMQGDITLAERCLLQLNLARTVSDRA